MIEQFKVDAVRMIYDQAIGGISEYLIANDENERGE
jgi:hypothetical protein